MHRSGTSLVTRLINHMGFFVGDDDKIMGGDPVFNPKGYWELLDLVALNDKLLYSIDCSWWKVSKIDIQRANEYHKSNFRTEFSNLISNLNNNEKWVVKDPRLILTFPLWNDLLTDYHIVFVNRNPYEVAMSLKIRDKCPVFFGMILWEFYMLKYAQVLHDKNYTLINYSKLINNPVVEINNLINSLSNAGFKNLISLENNNYIDEVDPDLYRNRLLDSRADIFETIYTKQVCELINNKNFAEILTLIDKPRISELHEMLLIYEDFVSTYNR